MSSPLGRVFFYPLVCVLACLQPPLLAASCYIMPLGVFTLFFLLSCLWPGDGLHRQGPRPPIRSLLVHPPVLLCAPLLSAAVPVRLLCTSLPNLLGVSCCLCLSLVSTSFVAVHCPCLCLPARCGTFARFYSACATVTCVFFAAACLIVLLHLAVFCC